MADTTTTPAPAGVPTFERRHRLALALETAGVSVSAMAELLGVTPTTVGNYLHDRTEPKDGVLRVWSMRCGVPFEWLAHGVQDDHRTGPNGGGMQAVHSSGCVTADDPSQAPDLHGPASGWDTADRRHLRPVAA